MKKFLVIAATAIVALTACSKTETSYLGENSEIGFKPINSVFTKVTQSSYVGELGVYGYDVTGDVELFQNTKFVKGEKEKDPWRGETPQYWPGGNTVRFTIYAPFNKAVTVGNGTIAYAKIPETEDFLYGQKVYESNKTNAGKDPLSVNLKHAKCKVKFTAKCDVDNAVTIQSITLKSATQGGDLAITYKDVNENPDLIWTRNPALGDVVIGGINNYAVTSTKTNVGKEMLLIPNDVNASKADETVKGKCEVIYKLANQTNPLTVSLDLSGIWERGKSYIYNLVFDSGEIKFNVTVDNWDDVTETELPVDKK